MSLIYSTEAQADLDHIADYTAERWGDGQTDSYLAQLEACCELLSRHPEVGHLQDFDIKGLRRFDQGSHAIYYLRQGVNLLVVQILHQRMVPTLREFCT